MTERKPTPPGWLQIELRGAVADDLRRGHRDVGGVRYRVYAASAWQLGAVKVISALEDAETRNGDGQLMAPHYHVSVSRHPLPANGAAVILAAHAFGLLNGYEVSWPTPPHVAAHLWRPVR